MDKQATTTEDDYTTEPIAKIDTGLTEEEDRRNERMMILKQIAM